MAYSQNFPAQRASFIFDAANSGRIPPNMTYTRASSANVWDGSKHLSSDNLLLQSSNFDTSWTRNDLGLTGSQTDPAGGTNGWTITEGSADGFHRLMQSISSGSADYALVIYAKQNTGTRYLTLSLVTGANNFEAATFDLAGGSPVMSSGSSSAFTSVSATQTASGNSYYKCVLKATGNPVDARINLVNSSSPSLSAYGSLSYAGDNSSSIDIAFSSLSTVGAIDYNATTTSIHRQYASSLVSKASNAARFEIGTDGQSAGTSLGILVEGQATNLNPQSDALASWGSNANLTLTSNAAIGPDGTLGADLMVGNTTNDSHYVRSTATTVSSSATYTLSGYFKSVNGEKVRLVVFKASSPYTGEADAKFTLSGNGSASVTTGSATITSVGGGYYRCTVTGTTLSTSSFFQVQTVSTGDAQDYVANDYNGVLCAGIQFESGSFASSLISTSGASATRAADNLSVTDASLFGTGSGAVAVEAGPVSGTFYPTLFDLTDTTTSNRVLLQSGGSGTPTSLTVAADGNASVGVVSEAVTMSNRKFAVSYDTNSFKIVNNGGTVSEDTSGQLPQQLSKLSIGTDNGGGGPLNGNIKRIAVFGEALSDTNLQAVTS